MRVTVADQEHCKKELVIEFSSEEVKSETDRVAAQLARTVKVPGFRPGHVPLSVIKTRFRKDLTDEVTSKLLPRAFTDAVQKNDLRVLGEPSVSDVRHGLDGSLGATFNVEVEPEFELADYKGLPLVKKVYKVTDKDIESAIESLQQQHAEMVPVEDRPSQSGDLVGATLQGWFENAQSAATEGEASEDADSQTPDADAAEAGGDTERTPDLPESPLNLELGREGVIAEFNEAFLGSRVGDKKDFVVKYADDYHSEKLAGKTVRYKGDVTSIGIKEPPDIEELVQLVSDQEKSVEEFRSDIKSQLEAQAESKTKEELNNSLLDILLDRNRFELPVGVVDHETVHRLRTLVQRWSQSGVDFRKLGVDWEELQRVHKKGVERDLRISFILDRISDKEEIDVTEADIDKRIQSMAERAGQDPAVLRARLTKENAVASMKAQVRNERALDLLIASADVRIEEVDGLNEAATESGEGEQGA